MTANVWHERRPVAGPDDLRERWRERSAAGGWSLPGDWWTPAVETVVTAACGAPGLAEACARLGAARGRAGVGLGQTLDDLGALFAELRWPDPPLSLVRCAAEGWAEAGLSGAPTDTCEDPLTGLLSAAYLRSRLAEVYRAGAAPGHALVLVDLTGGPEPWRRLARAIVVAHDLREVFRRGETLAMVDPARAAVLGAAGSRLDDDVRALRDLLGRTLADADDPRPEPLFESERFLIRVQRLPANSTTALALLES
ncbi:hypothetical protein [Actinomadura flavalba]|uniref:hypothetical protein n=1 Tax=Actinomadura flavalba TaxID=1120938 RepID=UPI000687A60C|nr:hypothetical protein [Actinomadura flavalba]